MRQFPRQVMWGLSPRVRGNLHAPGHSGVRNRSIPACAGEPIRPRDRWTSPRVYPRVCGGTRILLNRRQRRQGLSPRVRGNRPALSERADRGGSIPACAGEPRTAASSGAGRRVYPRVCGGTVGGFPVLMAGQGLSPRVRGNQSPTRGGFPWRGSIPACAGEPSILFCNDFIGKVYPRVCGGTATIRSALWTMEGLSPRVRGNR